MMKMFAAVAFAVLFGVADASAQTGYVVSGCNGVDDTAAIQAALNQANVTGGVVHNPARGETCAFSQPIVLQTGVIYDCGGEAGGSVLSTGGSGATFERWASRLLWVGSQSGFPQLVTCATNAIACGLKNCLVDGAGTPGSTTVYGVGFPSNLDFVLENVTVRNTQVAFYFGGDPPQYNPTANGAPQNVKCYNAQYCFIFYGSLNGQPLAPATDINIHGLSCWKYTGACIWTSGNDDIYVDGGYITSWGMGGTAYVFSSGPFRFSNQTVAIYPGDQFAVCGNTLGSHVDISVLFYNGNPPPTKAPGCNLIVEILD